MCMRVLESTINSVVLTITYELCEIFRIHKLIIICSVKIVNAVKNNTIIKFKKFRD